MIDGITRHKIKREVERLEATINASNSRDIRVSVYLEAKNFLKSLLESE